MIKHFFFKLKQDLHQLFIYPEVSLKDKFRVDYDKYWEKRRKGRTAVLSSWQKQRADHILKMVERDSRIMDIGCGDGALLKYLMENGGVKGIGVDIIQSELDKAKVLGIETHLVDLRNEEEIRLLPQVDYIMGLEILEHMSEPEVLIMNFKSKAAKGMIFSFPNSGYYFHRLRLLCGSFPLQWILHPGEHLRFWTVRDSKWWVSSMGFVLEKIVVYEGLPILNRMMPNLFGQGIIIKIHQNEK